MKMLFKRLFYIYYIDWCMPKKKKGLSVETERPLTIACHMKKSKNLFNVKHLLRSNSSSSYSLTALSYNELLLLFIILNAAIILNVFFTPICIT
ncbi:hypothetical protein A4D02_13855 [Niastella koreensis]|uniref:Uncharacterized protein n=1 Tax=Niastella koreensis TaxID=354356 RepID=A0ABX3NQB4_9BACT|nr:hypothetical protein A4D02_13855 [Niastella koreensis]